MGDTTITESDHERVIVRRVGDDVVDTIRQKRHYSHGGWGEWEDSERVRMKARNQTRIDIDTML